MKSFIFLLSEVRHFTLHVIFPSESPFRRPPAPLVSVLFIVGLIARSLVALTLVKIFAWACGKRRMIDDIAKGNSNQLAHFLPTPARDIKYTTSVGELEEKLEIMLPEIKENALALTSHHLQLSAPAKRIKLSSGKSQVDIETIKLAKWSRSGDMGVVTWGWGWRSCRLQEQDELRTWPSLPSSAIQT